MPKTSLENINHNRILSYLTDPEGSNLNDELKFRIQRLTVCDNLLDKYPNLKIAMKLYKLKFPEISDHHAYKDFNDAKYIFNSFKRHDKEWVRRWVINDIFRLIDAAKVLGSKGFKAWNTAHANLIKAAGLDQKEEITIDPEILQSHNFYTIINVSGKNVKADFEEFQALPSLSRKELSDAIFTRTITEDTAAELLGDGR